MLTKDVVEGSKTTLTVRNCKSNVKGVWVEGDMYHLCKYVYGARKSKSMLRPCVSVLNLRIRVCSCVNLSSLLEKSPNNDDRLTQEQTLIRKFKTLEGAILTVQSAIHNGDSQTT